MSKMLNAEYKIFNIKCLFEPLFKYWKRYRKASTIEGGGGVKAGLHIQQCCWQYCPRLFCLFSTNFFFQLLKCTSLEQYCQLYCPSKSLCEPGSKVISRFPGLFMYNQQGCTFLTGCCLLFCNVFKVPYPTCFWTL
jgi:hypothetical protein